MLTPKEAFKVGFLRRCAESGMSDAETHVAVKEAADFFVKVGISSVADIITSPYNALMRAASGVAETGGDIGLGVLGLGPPVLGGLAGIGLAKATDIDDTDVDAVKKRELIDEYDRQRKMTLAKMEARKHRLR